MWERQERGSTNTYAELLRKDLGELDSLPRADISASMMYCRWSQAMGITGAGMEEPRVRR